MKNLKYLKYILKHKYYVAIECFKFGLYWRGIKHDWSKFLPSEWFPYVEWFYGIGSYDDVFEQAWNKHYFETYHKNVPFRITKAGIKKAFDIAWLKHQHRNSHHWQYWILKEDSGKIIPLEMPHKDTIEMYCDWVGAGIAITGKRDIKEWYKKNYNNIILHENTRKIIDSLVYGNN